MLILRAVFVLKLYWAGVQPVLLDECISRLGTVDELIADPSYMNMWNAQPDCRQYLYQVHVTYTRRVQASFAAGDPLVTCETCMQAMSEHFYNTMQIYQYIFATDGFQNSSLGREVAGLSVQEDEAVRFTPATCIYQWTTGILIHYEDVSIRFVLGCVPSLISALLSMRTEFLQGRLACVQMLYWQLSLLAFIETPLCTVARSSEEASVLLPICRGVWASRTQQPPPERLQDWTYLYGNVDVDVTPVGRGAYLPVYSDAKTNDPPVYTSLRLRAARATERSGPRPTRDQLMEALHGGDVFDEFRHSHAFVERNSSCAVSDDFNVSEAQAFDPELIADLAGKVSAEVIIEVGVFHGRSTGEFAKRSSAYVVAVDSFLGDAYMWTTKKHRYGARMSRLAGLPMFYYCFLRACSAAAVEHAIVPLPQTSSQAFRVLDLLGVEADLIYIDAGHDVLDALQDVTHYWLLLRCGGIMFGDDYHWSSVRAVVDSFAAQHGVAVSVRGAHETKWVLSPKWCD